MNNAVVCMVRGAESGRATQEHAIHHARKNQQKLILLHVVNVNNLPIENEALLPAAREEMAWLARVTLNMARRRAEAAGVKVEIVILYGPLFEAVLDFLKETKVDRVFLGSPHRSAENYDQRLEHVRRFADRLSQESHVDFEVV